MQVNEGRGYGFCADMRSSTPPIFYTDSKPCKMKLYTESNKKGTERSIKTIVHEQDLIVGIITSTIHPYACLPYFFTLSTCVWKILQFCTPQKASVGMYTTIAISSGCDYLYKSCICLTLPSLLHPSILFNCLYTYRKIPS